MCTWTLFAALSGDGKLFGRWTRECRAMSSWIQLFALHRSILAFTFDAEAWTDSISVLVQRSVVQALLCKKKVKL